MLPTLRRREEGAAEAGSFLSLQAAAAPPQPLLALPGAPAAKPHTRGATTFGVNQIKTLPISTQCLLLETAPRDVLWVCAPGSEKLEGRDRRLGNGICVLACLFSGEVRVGCGQVETAPEYISFPYRVSGKGAS